MEGNAADSTQGPRFMLQASTIGKRKPVGPGKKRRLESQERK
jgi:hypothetical protein